MIRTFKIFEKKSKTPQIGDWVIVSRYRSPLELKLGIPGDDLQMGLYVNRTIRSSSEKQPYLISLSPEKIPNKSLKKIFNRRKGRIPIEHLNQYEWQVILNMAHITRFGIDEIFYFSQNKKDAEMEFEKLLKDIEMRKEAERYNL